MVGNNTPNPENLNLAPAEEALATATEAARVAVGALTLTEQRPDATDEAALGDELDVRARALLARADRTAIETYALVGLHIGARRMDKQQGDDHAHERLVDKLLTTQRAHDRFLDGRKTIIADGRRPMAIGVPDVFTLLKDQVSFHLTEPTLMHNIVGATYDRGGTRRPPRSVPSFLSASLLGVMTSERWSPQLRGLAAAIAMHVMAMRKIRSQVNPGLSSTDIPRVVPGREQDYWEARLFGLPEQDNEGIFYYLGYVDKSRAVLKAHMLRLWGPENYERNRNVVFAALCLRAGSIRGKDAKEQIKRLRRPLFRDIAQGRFEEAAHRLKLYAAAHPNLLPTVSKEYFEGRQDGADPLSTAHEEAVTE